MLFPPEDPSRKPFSTERSAFRNAERTTANSGLIHWIVINLRSGFQKLMGVFSQPPVRPLLAEPKKENLAVEENEPSSPERAFELDVDSEVFINSSNPGVDALKKAIFISRQSTTGRHGESLLSILQSNPHPEEGKDYAPLFIVCRGKTMRAVVFLSCLNYKQIQSALSDKTITQLNSWLRNLAIDYLKKNGENLDFPMTDEDSIRAT